MTQRVCDSCKAVIDLVLSSHLQPKPGRGHRFVIQIEPVSRGHHSYDLCYKCALDSLREALSEEEDRVAAGHVTHAG